MSSLAGKHSSVYWGSAAVAPRRIDKTRNISIDMGTDFVDDTVHGSQVRTFQPTFPSFGATVTGLYDTATAATTGSKQIIDDALAGQSGTWSLYMGNISRYITGSGYVSVNEYGAPFDDMSTFNFAIKSLGTVSNYQIGG